MTYVLRVKEEGLPGVDFYLWKYFDDGDCVVAGLKQAQRFSLAEAVMMKLKIKAELEVVECSS